MGSGRRYAIGGEECLKHFFSRLLTVKADHVERGLFCLKVIVSTQQITH